MEIASNFRFLVNFGSGFIEAFPLNKTLVWAWSRPKDRAYYLEELETELLFNKTDFKKLYDLERSGTICEPIEIQVLQTCDEVESLRFYGYLALIDGKWNVSRRQVSIKPRVKDPAECFREVKDDKINLFEIVFDRIEASAFVGELQFQTCSGFQFVDDVLFNEPIDDCLSGSAWGVYKQEAELILQPPLLSVKTTWVREFVQGGPEPSGTGWISEGSDWVREVELVFDTGEYTQTFFVEQWAIVGAEGTEQNTFDNGMLWNNTIERIFHRLSCNYTIVSNFFGINPDGTNPVNDEYLLAFDELQHLAIWEKSDIIRAAATENASVLEITLKRLLEISNIMFQTDWDVDGDIFRIEHYSYFKGERKMDLTQPDFLKYLEGNWKYDYLKSELVKSEKFEWAEASGVDFVGTPIEYPTACSTNAREEKTITFALNEVTTDLSHLAQAKNNTSLNGVVIIALDYYQGKYIINKDLGQLNGRLSWVNLHDHYYRWNRPHRTGIINGVDTVFASYKRVRKQVPINVKICCAEIMGEFNPRDYIKTQLGWGEVLNSKYDELTEILTVELLHD